ncbi:glycerol acyltransferase [Mycobacterium dioxanotrophicus]|jgi:1-acyl-sn-glycerol-3-phosphate acyltransferase|uniref:Glycerol acyltransferase n=1 Tax=Mycobacterium dioxanotrophicus TaxID=482462 RepID=A0A1Y0C2J2_9MYCO|nr:lysophospholipid acyltransferase family protein [Mycobacterium dioxanotrophicus]ART69347.1 glycerol acyltransferase [Mycobacterium dioxanotrophicus]
MKSLNDRQARVDLLEKGILAAARKWDHIRPAYKPYVDGLENLPADGRFLIVGNHTAVASTEIGLILYEVQRHLGIRVRALMDRQFGKLKGFPAEFLAAGGGIVGEPCAAGELMSANEPILVFPGGGREIAKARDELYTLLWGDRAGFARLAAEYDYPIVTAAVVGGDDVYKILTSRDGVWSRVSGRASELLSGRTDMAIQLMRGIGPTLVPRPQRLYARFSAPIDTTRPADVAAEDWVATIRAKTKSTLESDLAELQEIRAGDPFRNLAPWSWGAAVMPPASAAAQSTSATHTEGDVVQ